MLHIVAASANWIKSMVTDNLHKVVAPSSLGPDDHETIISTIGELSAHNIVAAASYVIETAIC